MHRRTAILGGLCLPGLASAQAPWPTRPIRLVLGYPPGGSVDAVARLLQPGLAAALGQPIVIDNRGGAAGAIGTAEAARAAPDGHSWTILFTPQALNEAVMRSAGFNLREDFAPVSIVGSGPMVLVTQPGGPFADARALVAAARQAPDTIPYATGGIGTLEHVSMVLLQELGGFRVTHVPYRGGGPALQAILSRDVPVCMSNLPIAVSHIAAGTVRALGVTTPGETRHLAGVPGLAGLGFPGFEALNWWVVAAPARTPEPILRRMHEAVANCLRDPATRARLEALGMDVRDGTEAEARAFVLAEQAKWSRVARENRITADG